MKQFLHRKWHGISFGVIAAVLAVLLIAGGVAGAFVLTHITSNPAVVTIRGTTETYTLSSTVLDWTVPAIIDQHDVVDCTASVQLTNTGNVTINSVILSNIASNGDLALLGGTLSASLSAPILKGETGTVNFTYHIPDAPVAGSYGLTTLAFDMAPSN